MYWPIVFWVTRLQCSSQCPWKCSSSRFSSCSAFYLHCYIVENISCFSEVSDPRTRADRQQKHWSLWPGVARWHSKPLLPIDPEDSGDHLANICPREGISIAFPCLCHNGNLTSMATLGTIKLFEIMYLVNPVIKLNWRRLGASGAGSETVWV